MITFVIQYHPHCPCPNLWYKLVRRLAHIGSTYSEVEASSKPGAVQTVVRDVLIDILKIRVTIFRCPGRSAGTRNASSFLFEFEAYEQFAALKGFPAHREDSMPGALVPTVHHRD